MKTTRRPSICATSIAAFLAAAAVSPGDTYQVDLGDNLTVSSVIPNFITKNGGGTLTLAATNALTGAVNVNDGALVISSIGNLAGATSISINHNPAPGTTGNTGLTQGVSAGQLLIAGTYLPQTFNFAPFGGLNLAGGGPGGNGSALNVVGNVTVSGGVTTSSTTATRLASNFGVLNIPALAISSLGGTTAQTLTLIGNGHYTLSGLTGTGQLTKGGLGTLVLTGSSSNTGIVEMNGGFVRVQTGANLGASAAANAINFNTGTLEVRTDDGSGFTTKGVSIATNNGTLNIDRAVAGTNATALNQTVTFGNLTLAPNRNITFNGRNGYGLTFGSAPGGGNNQNTITNNTNGTLTFTGNVWGNTVTSAETLTFTGAGDTTLNANLTTAATAGAHIVVKAGTGTLTILGTADHGGLTDIRDGTWVARSFSSLGNATNAANINLGNQGTTGTLTFIGATGTGAVGSSSRNIVLNGISNGGGRINASQVGSAATAVVITGNVGASTATNARTLTLGGSSVLDNEISGVINNGASATVSLVKTDSGTWVLSGANTYTGGTTISNGTLKLKANAPASTVLSDTTPVTFNLDAPSQAAGGRLVFAGNAGGATTEIIGPITTTLGHGVVRVENAGVLTTLSTSLTTGGANSAGASIDFQAPGALDSIVLTSPAANSGFIRGSAYFNSNNYAFVGAGGVVRAPLYGTDAGYATTSTLLTTSAHNEVTGAGFALTGGTTAINSLLITGSGTPTLTMAATDQLQINTGSQSVGGILLAGGSATISGGSVTQGQGAAGGALVVRVDGGANVLTLASSIAASTAGGLSKNGLGTLVLTALNNQTGVTNINEGIIRLSGVGRLSAASQTLSIRQGATLDLNGVSSGTSIGQFNGAGLVTNGSSVAATLTVGGGNGTGTWNGVIQDGSSQVSVIKQGTGAQTWGGLNTYTGSVTINSSGLVSVPVLADIGQPSGIGAGSVGSNAGSLLFGNAANTNIGGGITYTGADSVSINRLFTLGSQVATAANGARINASGANNATLIFNNSAPIAYTAGGSTVAQTLSLGGTSSGANAINLALVNPSAGSAVLSVLKDGAGVWRLGNAANSYTGRTTISAGILNAEGSALSSGSPLVINGGVLEMGGTFARALTTTPTIGVGAVNFTAGGGFASSDSKLTVNLGGAGAPVTWNSGGFLPNTGVGGTVSSALLLNSVTALDEVEFQNGIDLNNTGGTIARVITVVDNVTTSLDRATISGVISGDVGSVSLTKNGNGVLYLTGANTFTGTTNLAAGVLGVTSVTTGLGNAANVLNLNGNGVRFEYVGAGESSARTVTISNNATVNASGSGALVLSGLVNGASTAARTLTLEGQNTDANEVSSVLADSGTGVLTVAKGGPGTWILSGANTFTGTLSATSGNLGVTQTASGGAGTFTITAGNLFADGGDVTLANPVVNLGQNATAGFIGLNSITLSGPTVNVGNGGNSAFNNFLPAGKTLTITGTVSNTDGAANRSLNIGGTGRTVMSGLLQDRLGTAAQTLAITLNSGNLVLGGAVANTYSGATTIAGGTLELAGASGNAIPSGAGRGALAFTNTVLPATLLLNGLSETVNGFTGTSTGVKTVDNNSAAAATLTIGEANGLVNFNGNITNSLGGPLSIIKTGTAAGSLSGSTLSYSGTTEVQTGGSLAFPAGAPVATTGITVAGGASLSLINGTGTPIAGLNTLNLGAGVGTTNLGLDVGSISDVLTTSAAATTTGAINFAINAVTGFSPAGGTYDLLVSGGGGFVGPTYGLSAIPGGFTYTIDTTDANKVRLVATPTIGGETYFWTGDLNRSWSAIDAGNTNWEKGGAEAGATPGATDTVVFSSTITPPGTAAGNIISTTLDGNRTIDNLQFNGSPTVGTVAPTVHIAQGVTGVLTITPSSNTTGITIPDLAGAASISAPVELGADQTWRVNSVGSPTPLLTVSGVMSGTGSLTKEGPGSVTLTGVNTRQSTTTINAGVLNINAEVALGANPAGPNPSHLTINGGTLRATAALTIDDVNRGIELGGAGGTFDGSAAASNITIASTNVISGPGSLTKNGANTLILNGANTYGGPSGTTTINAGIVQVGNPTALSNSAVSLNGTGVVLEVANGINSTNAVTVSDAGNEKTLRLLAGATSGQFSGPITVNETAAGNLRVSASALGTLTISGAITTVPPAVSGIRKEGAGTVILSNSANALRGPSSVAAGILMHGANDVLPSTTAVTVNGNGVVATLDLNGFNQTVGSITYNGTGGGVGSANSVITGSGILTLGGNVTVNANGNPTTPALLSGNVSIGATRTFTVADSTGSVTDLNVTGPISSTGTAAVGITKAGAGVMLLGGANTYTGVTSVTAGILRNSANNVIPGALTVNAGAAVATANYDLAGFSEAVGTLTFGGTSTVTNAVNSVTTGVGTLTLDANVVTTASSATPTLQAQIIGNLAIPATRTFTVADAAAQAVDLQISAGTITGAGGVTKLGPGTMEIAATSSGSYAGATAVNAGTLLVNGSISGAVTLGGGTLGGTGTVGTITATAGTVSPGNSIGTLTASSLTMSGPSSFKLEINTSTLGTDLLSTTGALSLDVSGTPLLVSDLGADVPLSLGQTFTFITYTGLPSGLFSVGGTPILDDTTYFTVGANQFAIDYNAAGPSVQLVVVPEPGIAASLLGGFGMLVGLQRIRRRNDRRA